MGIGAYGTGAHRQGVRSSEQWMYKQVLESKECTIVQNAPVQGTQQTAGTVVNTRVGDDVERACTAKKGWKSTCTVWVKQSKYAVWFKSMWGRYWQVEGLLSPSPLVNRLWTGRLFSLSLTSTGCWCGGGGREAVTGDELRMKLCTGSQTGHH